MIVQCCRSALKNCIDQTCNLHVEALPQPCKRIVSTCIREPAGCSAYQLYYALVYCDLFSTVYLCRRRADSKLVIIKEIQIDDVDREGRQEALTEARVLAMLKHPNIIDYYDSFLEDKALMIAMEYAEGTLRVTLVLICLSCQTPLRSLTSLG